MHQSHAGDVFLRVFGRVPERVYRLFRCTDADKALLRHVRNLRQGRRVQRDFRILAIQQAEHFADHQVRQHFDSRGGLRRRFKVVRQIFAGDQLLRRVRRQPVIRHVRRLAHVRQLRQFLAPSGNDFVAQHNGR